MAARQNSTGTIGWVKDLADLSISEAICLFLTSNHTPNSSLARVQLERLGAHLRHKFHTLFARLSYIPNPNPFCSSSLKKRIANEHLLSKLRGGRSLKNRKQKLQKQLNEFLGLQLFLLPQTRDSSEFFAAPLSQDSIDKTPVFEYLSALSDASKAVAEKVSRKGTRLDSDSGSDFDHTPVSQSKYQKHKKPAISSHMKSKSQKSKSRKPKTQKPKTQKPKTQKSKSKKSLSTQSSSPLKRRKNTRQLKLKLTKMPKSELGGLRNPIKIDCSIVMKHESKSSKTTASSPASPIVHTLLNKVCSKSPENSLQRQTSLKRRLSPSSSRSTRKRHKTTNGIKQERKCADVQKGFTDEKLKSIFGNEWTEPFNNHSVRVSKEKKKNSWKVTFLDSDGNVFHKTHLTCENGKIKCDVWEYDPSKSTETEIIWRHPQKNEEANWVRKSQADHNSNSTSSKTPMFTATSSSSIPSTSSLSSSTSQHVRQASCSPLAPHSSHSSQPKPADSSSPKPHEFHRDVRKSPQKNEHSSPKHSQTPPTNGFVIQGGDTCAVCRNGDSWSPNLIIFCDGCDKGYHQKCRNVEVVPDGNWYCCRKCQIQGDTKSGSEDQSAADSDATVSVDSDTERELSPQQPTHQQNSTDNSTSESRHSPKSKFPQPQLLNHKQRKTQKPKRSKHQKPKTLSDSFSEFDYQATDSQYFQHFLPPKSNHSPLRAKTSGKHKNKPSKKTRSNKKSRSRAKPKKLSTKVKLERPDSGPKDSIAQSPDLSEHSRSSSFDDFETVPKPKSKPFKGKLKTKNPDQNKSTNIDLSDANLKTKLKFTYKFNRTKAESSPPKGTIIPHAVSPASPVEKRQQIFESLQMRSASPPNISVKQLLFGQKSEISISSADGDPPTNSITNGKCSSKGKSKKRKKRKRVRWTSAELNLLLEAAYPYSSKDCTPDFTQIYDNHPELRKRHRLVQLQIKWRNMLAHGKCIFPKGSTEREQNLKFSGGRGSSKLLKRPEKKEASKPRFLPSDSASSSLKTELSDTTTKTDTSSPSITSQQPKQEPKESEQSVNIDEMSDDSSSESDSDSELMHASLSKEQRELMRKNHMEIQMRFKQAMERQSKQKVHDIHAIIRIKGDESVTENEVLFMLKMCKDDETEVMERLNQEPKFVESVREMIEEKKKLDANPKLKAESEANDLKRKRARVDYAEDRGEDWIPSSDDEGESESDFDEEDEDDVSDYEEKSPYRRPTRRRANASSAASSSASSSSTPVAVNPVEPRRSVNPKADGTTYKKSSGVSGVNLDGSRRVKRLLLDDALKDPKKQAGWSEARKKAWAQKGKNPNSYYYRFNDPGEVQRGSRFTKAEEEVFFTRLEKVGPSCGWGIFAMGIPGRVGYQCSNFYRLAIMEGKIKDERYWMDENGKLRFNRRGRPDGQPIIPIKPKQKTKRAPRKRATTVTNAPRVVKKRKQDEEDFIPVGKIEPVEQPRNPIPEMMDSITKETMVNPAVSPYGHVLGYDTWQKVLRQKPENTCPFTKQTLRRRQLVKLTEENFHEYKNKILNM